MPSRIAVILVIVVLLLGALALARGYHHRVLADIQAHFTTTFLSMFALGFAVVALWVNNYISSLRDDVRDLHTMVEETRAHADERVRKEDERVHRLLSSSRAPLLSSPLDNSSRVGKFVVLEWEDGKEAIHPNYVVEIIHLNGERALIVATNPFKRSTRYPVQLQESIKPGQYLWRVAPGDLKGEKGETVFGGGWSGYSTFTIYPSVIERIRQTSTLRVGVNYIQDSSFMRRSDKGNPEGFDRDLIERVAQALPSALNVKEIKLEFIDYHSIESMLMEGLLAGEVDVAIGSITINRDRREHGIMFTKGYYEAHLVLIGKEKPGVKGLANIRHSARVGVVHQTSNEEPARDLKARFGFRLAPVDSFQDLVKDLEFGNLDYIIIDEPLAEPLLGPHDGSSGFAVVDHLEPYLGAYLKRQIGAADSVEQYGIAVADKNLLATIDPVVQAQKGEGGFLDQLAGKYGLGQGHAPRKQALAAVAATSKSDQGDEDGRGRQARRGDVDLVTAAAQIPPAIALGAFEERQTTAPAPADVAAPIDMVGSARR